MKGVSRGSQPRWDHPVWSLASWKGDYPPNKQSDINMERYAFANGSPRWGPIFPRPYRWRGWILHPFHLFSSLKMVWFVGGFLCCGPSPIHDFIKLVQQFKAHGLQNRPDWALASSIWGGGLSQKATCLFVKTGGGGRVMIFPWFFDFHKIHVWLIFTYIWLVLMVNVGKYTIHGCYGYTVYSCIISYQTVFLPPISNIFAKLDHLPR